MTTKKSMALSRREMAWLSAEKEKVDQATTIATKAASGLTTPVTPPLNVVSMMEKTHISKKRAWRKANDETYIQVDFEDLDARSVGSACTDRQSLIKDIWGNWNLMDFGDHKNEDSLFWEYAFPHSIHNPGHITCQKANCGNLKNRPF